MHGLIIRAPWIDRILDGTKIWEMRTSPARRRGRIGLVRKGTGLVVGTAELVESLPPLDAATFAVTRHRHRIPADLDAEVLKAGWVHPWVLRNVRRLPRPVPAGQKPGQVIWVPMDPAAIAAIDAQTGEAVRPVAPDMATFHTARAAMTVSVPTKAIVAPQQPEPRAAHGPDEVMLELTEGAIRQGNLSVRKALHLLSNAVIGGSNKDDAAPQLLTVVFNPGETARTDIAGDKMLLRCRGAVRDFYTRSGAKKGDLVTMRRDRAGILHVQLMP